MRVRFLPKEKIEASARNLLGRYRDRFGLDGDLPVPVEEILESFLGLGLEFGDLRERLGVSDVLGATWVKERRVIIDQSLDPTEDPRKEGRYRFTIAHELGHWELHRHPYEAVPGQGVLFHDHPEPSIVCRSKSRKDPMEWQADTFAGYLLMPKEMVFDTWESIHGTRDPYDAIEEVADLSVRLGLGEEKRPTVRVARDLAEIFQVSGQAMQIRLSGLGLIRLENASPGLFDGSV
ncbi:MAG: ImmA/IrrE family metallo-endopeptidase [Magnetococcales bacterium]|nr:ImmA/IrrE family metallo-endopeptidase [Magnetococcales bacterium]